MCTQGKDETGKEATPLDPETHTREEIVREIEIVNGGIGGSYPPVSGIDFTEQAWKNLKNKWAEKHGGLPQDGFYRVVIPIEGPSRLKWLRPKTPPLDVIDEEPGDGARGRYRGQVDIQNVEDLKRLLERSPDEMRVRCICPFGHLGEVEFGFPDQSNGPDWGLVLVCKTEKKDPHKKPHVTDHPHAKDVVFDLRCQICMEALDSAIQLAVRSGTLHRDDGELVPAGEQRSPLLRGFREEHQKDPSDHDGGSVGSSECASPTR